MNTEIGLLDQSLNKIKFVCHLTGINIKNEKPKARKLALMYLLNFQWLNSDWAGAIWKVVSGIMNNKNFEEITSIAPCVTFSLLGNMKSLSILFYGNKLQQVISSLKKMETNDKDLMNKSNVKDMIQEHVGFLHLLIKVLNITYTVLNLGFTLNPLILIVYRYYKTNEVKLVLPFFISYPFDAYDIKIWPAVYLHQIWSNVVAVLFIAASDYIFYTCCSHVTMRFVILHAEIEDLVRDKISLINFQSKFREIVKRHQELMSCTQLLEDIFSMSTLCNFVSSSVIICLTGFDAMIITEKVVVLTFVSFLFTSLLQTYFLCYFGDSLMRSSMGVGDAAYRCIWYNKETKISKSLLLIMIRSHKPCKLTAYGFADVNLTAFMKILSRAWSYFALLNTIYG